MVHLRTPLVRGAQPAQPSRPERPAQPARCRRRARTTRITSTIGMSTLVNTTVTSSDCTNYDDYRGRAEGHSNQSRRRNPEEGQNRHDRTVIPQTGGPRAPLSVVLPGRVVLTRQCRPGGDMLTGKPTQRRGKLFRGCLSIPINFRPGKGLEREMTGHQVMPIFSGDPHNRRSKIKRNKK